MNLPLMSLCPTPGALAVATSLMLTLGGVVLLLLFLRGKVRGVLHPLRLLAGAVLSVLLYLGLAVASNALLGAADGKLMLVVKCGALGCAALGVYLLLMGRAALGVVSCSSGNGEVLMNFHAGIEWKIPDPALGERPRILFVGNSHTFYNNFSGMFVNIVEAKGKKSSVYELSQGY